MADKNDLAFAELVHNSLISDVGRKRKHKGSSDNIRAHYAGSNNPRIIRLYNHLTI